MTRSNIHLVYAFGGVLAACVALAFCPVGGPVVVSGETHGSPAASFEKQTATLEPGKAGAKPVDLGELGLGSIRELVITLPPGTAQTGFTRVESSCSCLQPLTQPTLRPGGKSQECRARYFAVRSGPVDVTLAFSRAGAEGKEEILTARVIGKVAEDDASLSTRLAELVKTPLPVVPAFDPAGVVSAAAARTEVESGRGLVVDIRPKEEFSWAHIEGALNIPVTQLKPSGAFRGRDLYLTGPPLPTLGLREARRALLRGGVANVHILRDGAPGWKAAGGRVFEEIDPPPLISGITVDELRETPQDESIVVLGAGMEDPFAFRYAFANGEPVDSPALAETVNARLAAAPSVSVVIVDETGDRFGLLNQSAPAHWLGRVSYLRAGFPAYREALEKRALLASRVPEESGGSARGFAQRAPGQRVGVPVPVGSPGCGTCPKR